MILLIKRFGLGIIISSWRSIGLCLIIIPLAYAPVMSQEKSLDINQPQPQILWHQAQAIFSIRVHLPKNYDSTKTYPAIIALHGHGSSPEKFERVAQAFTQVGFVAILPEGPYTVPSTDSVKSSSWELSTFTSPPLTNDPMVEFWSAKVTAMEFIPSVIDRIKKQYRLGPLFAFGFSMGGVFAILGSFYNSDHFEGVIAFGVRGVERDWFTVNGGSIEDGNHLKVRLVQGRSDPMVPFSHAERARDLFKAAGYEVTLDDFSGGHTIPNEALERAVNWLVKMVGR